MRLRCEEESGEGKGVFYIVLLSETFRGCALVNQHEPKLRGAKTAKNSESRQIYINLSDLWTQSPPMRRSVDQMVCVTPFNIGMIATLI
jgi:hypothetical protein